MVKRKTYKKSNNDTFARVQSKILESEAFKSLTPRQQVLYFYCKNEEYHPKRYKPDKEDLTKFYFNELIWSDKTDPTTGRQGYGLYNANKYQFYRDMDALIEKGLIRCIACGANNKERNIYQYSDKWQKYGKPDFEILPTEMTKSLVNKRNKKRKVKS